MKNSTPKDYFIIEGQRQHNSDFQHHFILKKPADFLSIKDQKNEIQTSIINTF